VKVEVRVDQDVPSGDLITALAALIVARAKVTVAKRIAAQEKKPPKR
jgi:hypothetical protein